MVVLEAVQFLVILTLNSRSPGGCLCEFTKNLHCVPWLNSLVFVNGLQINCRVEYALLSLESDLFGHSKFPDCLCQNHGSSESVFFNSLLHGLLELPVDHERFNYGLPSLYHLQMLSFFVNLFVLFVQVDCLSLDSADIAHIWVVSGRPIGASVLRHLVTVLLWHNILSASLKVVRSRSISGGSLSRWLVSLSPWLLVLAEFVLLLTELVASRGQWPILLGPWRALLAKNLEHISSCSIWSI